jgi:fructose-1-phosphate kinase PfkB-like protein
MTGAMAAGWALGLEWLDVLILGTAAGSANFLRHGLGTGSKAVVDELVGQVHVRSAQA